MRITSTIETSKHKAVLYSSFVQQFNRGCTGASVQARCVRAVCTERSVQALLYRQPVHVESCTGSLYKIQTGLYRLPVQTACTEPVQSILYRAFSVQSILYRAFCTEHLLYSSFCTDEYGRNTN